MKGGHDSAAGVRIHHGSSVGNAWPTGKAAWRAYAASVMARFPLAGTDWDQHRDCIESGFYSLQNCTEIAAPAAAPDCEYAEPPLSPDEEEQLATLF